MEIILATKNTTPIIGQISSLMGLIMDGIYRVLSLIGIQNIGLCIIIFSIIIYLLMTPLQISQQKFSKLSSVMNPEIQKIQKKYQGKRDQESMQRMQEETQAVYAKYGVSASGSCIQLIIQLPVLWALWQVIYKIPAYVGSIKAIFTEAVDKIVMVNGYTDILQNFITENRLARARLILEDGVATKNSIIDVLYSLSPAQWESFSSIKDFSDFSSVLESTASKISPMQNFLGLNISEMPLYYIRNVLQGGAILLAIVALMIPFLAWATQMLNLKLMPQNPTSDDGGAMGSSMKTMNTVMPIMSAVFCFTFPVGLGIYWIASAVVRSIQQVVINKQLDKIDIEELTKKNMKKYEEKRAKEGLPPSKITNQAHQSVRNINTVNREGVSQTNTADKSKKIQDAYDAGRKAKPGSMTAKANMVRDFEERNKKK